MVVLIPPQRGGGGFDAAFNKLLLPLVLYDYIPSGTQQVISETILSTLATAPVLITNW